MEYNLDCQRVESVLREQEDLISSTIPEFTVGNGNGSNF